jgi:lactoylglutathione lyase
VKIEHVAIWTNDLERLKEFYIRYFNAVAGKKYNNPVRQFESYFLSFESGSRLELMKLPTIRSSKGREEFIGLTHLAISVGSKQLVDELTETLRKDDITIIGEPRTTGDGYYESVILDPDGNRIEITI